MAEYKITKKSKERLIDTIATNLPTERERRTFIKTEYPELLSQLEKNPKENELNGAWRIYFLFKDNRMLGSLSSTIMRYFNPELKIVFKLRKKYRQK
jgi:hypothetical protein